MCLLSDICLKEVTSIADSLYNIQLLKEFANEYLNKSFYLTIEDMLYSPLVLKVNIPYISVYELLHVPNYFWDLIPYSSTLLAHKILVVRATVLSLSRGKAMSLCDAKLATDS